MPSIINPTLVLLKKQQKKTTLIQFHNIGLNEIILRVGLILMSFLITVSFDHFFFQNNWTEEY